MTRNSDTMLMGVLYPGVEPYLADYLGAVNAQTDKNFDLVIYDHCSEIKIPKADIAPVVIQVGRERTPADIRSMGISYAINKEYTYLIFSDIDDYFSENRIVENRIALRQADFVYNELKLVDSNTKLIKDNLFQNGFLRGDCEALEDIIDYNILGLGHTGVRCKACLGLTVPSDLVAIDWFIFTLLIIQGRKGVFAGQATTYYRQNKDNTIGMSKLLSETRLKQGVEIKIGHYHNLARYCEGHGYSRPGKLIQSKQEEMQELKKVLVDPGFRENYIKVINEHYKEIFRGWWSEILTLPQWRKYAE